MNLHALCHYRAKSEEWTDGWRKEDFSARNLVKAVKCKDFRGYSGVKVGDREFKIEDTPAGQSAALSASALALAGRITAAGYKSAAVIPVPASNHIDPSQMFTGRKIAEAIQKLSPTLVSRPVLYFDEVLEPAAAGGTRSAFQIKRHLRFVVGQIQEDAVVLIDDVCTTGGHLRGASLFLGELGYHVEDAFVIGRTTWERPESMFKVPGEAL